MNPFSTLTDLADGLRNRQFSSVELTRFYLDRIERLDVEYNSFITVTRDRAQEQAAAADAKLRAGNATPLTGLPIAHKDIFCTAGVRTSCGSKMLDSFIAPYDATAVTRLDAAGAVTLGKTNMDEFAMGSSCETSYYGPVRNPWDTDARTGRLVGRLGCRNRGWTHAGGNRHRYRRIDPPTGRIQRRLRIETDLRMRVALRHGRVRIEPGPGWSDGAQRRRHRAAARCDGRVRHERFDERADRPRR